MTQRISDMLSVHLKELTRKHPPAAPLPSEVTTNALQDWKAKVRLNRGGDIEFAARALGRLEMRGSGSTRLISRDLSGGVNLQGCDLSGLNFRNADFTFTNLQGSNCTGSDFSKATLTSAKLEHSNFSFGNLVDADLSYSEASHSDFSFSNMQGAFLEITNLQHSVLSFCKLESAHFTETDLTGANFDDAELTNVIISNPILDENASFIGTNFFWSRVSLLRPIALLVGHLTTWQHTRRQDRASSSKHAAPPSPPLGDRGTGLVRVRNRMDPLQIRPPRRLHPPPQDRDDAPPSTPP